MSDLHDTRMGVRLIEGTMPNIAMQLKRIADALEAKSNSEGMTQAGELPYINGLPNIVDKPSLSCHYRKQLIESI